MKITRFQIGSYHQFKNFDLPLVYPDGHSKAGRPLEKVCFIGQSGTGKTTLLNIISAFTHKADKISLSELEESSIRLNYRFDNMNDTSFFDKGKILLENPTIDGIKVDEDDYWEAWSKLSSKLKTILINFPADLFLNFEAPENNSNDASIQDQRYYDFSTDKAVTVWKLILKEIQDYQESELKLRQQISKAVENSKTDLNAIQDELRKLEQWKAITFNPISDIAKKCLDPLLRAFNLRVKTELDFQKKDDIGFIKIEALNGQEIPNGLLSTGTKQIILSALPLYLLKPENTIILFDEPERSLFPDMQRLIIDFYSSLTTDSQFFYATHSPIIASAFEPCERIILSFDNKGYVQWKYGLAPVGDDPNDILKKDFGMQNLMHDRGVAAYNNYLQLKSQLRTESNPEKKDLLILEISKIANEYDF